MRTLLYPLSLIYRGLAAADRRRTVPVRLPRPVISVGNLTWGGTGKTPTVALICRSLQKAGRRPAVLTRGYRRKSSGAEPVIVSDGTGIRSTPEAAGDEPFLLAELVPGGMVVAGPDRARSAAAALNGFNPDVFVLDDGFQHWKLARDLDIVCVNAADPFGNGHVIPAGTLREPLNALGRAGLLLITSADRVPEKRLVEIEQTLRRHTAAPVVRARYVPSGWRRLLDNAVFPVGDPSFSSVTAFSGLADNRGFTRTLESLNVTVVDHIAFRDHYWYNNHDVRRLSGRSSHRNPVVTTAKDAVRLKPLLSSIPAADAAHIYALDVEMQLLSGESLWLELIQNALRSFSTATAR